LQLQVAAAFPPVICGTTAGIATLGVPSFFYYHIKVSTNKTDIINK
jgi:hypothetical protein